MCISQASLVISNLNWLLLSLEKANLLEGFIIEYIGLEMRWLPHNNRIRTKTRAVLPVLAIESIWPSFTGSALEWMCPKLCFLNKNYSSPYSIFVAPLSVYTEYREWTQFTHSMTWCPISGLGKGTAPLRLNREVEKQLPWRDLG